MTGKDMKKADLMEYVVRYKWAVLLCAMLLVAVAIGALSGRQEGATEKAAGLAAVKAGASARFVNGDTWIGPDSLEIPSAERLRVKATLLKTTLESSILNGNAFILPDSPLEEYAVYIDAFYKREDNRQVPLFFALKMADMAQDGADDLTVGAYKRMVMEKLRSSGLL